MANECEFTVISADDPDDPAENREYLKQAKKDNAGAIIAESLADMVDKVLNKADDNKCDCIKTLRIIGHGSEGKIVIGKGRSGSDARKRINEKKSEWEDQLARLKPRFCKKARVEFLACWFGAGEKGAKKLSDLADHLGVTTVGHNVRLKPGGYPDKSKKGYKEVVAKPGKPAAKVDRVEARLPSLKTSRSAFAALDRRLPDALCVVSGSVPASDGDLPRGLFIEDRDNMRGLLAQIDRSRTIDARMVGGCVDARLVAIREGAAAEVFDITDDFEHIGRSGELRKVQRISACGRSWLRQLAFLHKAYASAGQGAFPQ